MNTGSWSARAVRPRVNLTRFDSCKLWWCDQGESVFFGPMAVVIMDCLLAATIMTLLFLPALDAAWLKVPCVSA